MSKAEKPPELDYHECLEITKEYMKRRSDLEDAIIHECEADCNGDVFVDKLIKAIENEEIPYLRIDWTQK